MQREPRGILGRHVRPRARDVWSDALTGASAVRRCCGRLVVACSSVKPSAAERGEARPEASASSAEEITVTGSRREESRQTFVRFSASGG